ncbi:hypothetical protein EDD18DRAFT_1310711 [Armillaria luteobubalina]|uniref:CxC1-like cysteine cluster associated with KDZ transposases domain-containing protein n=1 Tax=Armillaria luteobubalina TaxID=153913 RepID=A0AA39PYV3_9AGAR|nr:hypothetical protein EDD18DRAFT_1310711 [Armillaria luteobubalina]
MEIFHTTTLRCPQMSVQGFVRALCDLHSYPIAGGLQEQFSICYDVFIAILENVEHCIMKELGRDNIDWCLRNCCPACTFELNGEEQLEFCMLGAMDGNNSLKRIPQNSGKVSIERDDSRDGGGSYILPQSEVNCWSKEVIGDAETVKTEELTPCEEHWKNMSDDRTSKMWGVFEETGFFLSLCRHGSVLLGADMVKSGEQAKYPLTIVSRLLKVFGEQLGMGYDIGCKFSGTVSRSPLGKLAKAKKFRLGLEDLETLEHFFSKLNALAGRIRYASRFHRCKFLCNNYRQALQIIETELVLKKSMHDLGVANEKEFDSWLKEEVTYLSGLQQEAPEETVEMEYFARLVHYYALESKVTASQRISFVNTMTETLPKTQDDTCKMETTQRQLMEKRSQELEHVQDLEQSLNISPDEHWMVRCEKWAENEQQVAMHTYRQHLDRLEGLIVSWIFELTKMNMSHTAIRTALSQYNAAAAVLKPPRPALQWEHVVEYAFLADFDLLCDIQQDMSQRKWATPAGQKAMDMYFKICCAKEEIRHLNIEIQHVITYMHTEDIYLQHHEKALATTSPTLALQVSQYRRGRERFYNMHMCHFYVLSQEPNFTGDIMVGTVATPSQQDESMDINNNNICHAEKAINEED